MQYSESLGQFSSHEAVGFATSGSQQCSLVAGITANCSDTRRARDPTITASDDPRLSPIDYQAGYEEFARLTELGVEI